MYVLRLKDSNPPRYYVNLNRDTLEAQYSVHLADADTIDTLKEARILCEKTEEIVPVSEIK